MPRAAEILRTPATDPVATLVLAHGAGAAMDSPFMEAMTERLSARGLSVARFEFAYMAMRRKGGPRKPPPRADRLIGEYAAALTAIAEDSGPGPLLIGGKSLGGRVAAMAAADAEVAGVAAGVVCLGYPFHAIADATDVRLAPLQQARLPVLVCQGDRDPFGNAAEIAGWDIPETVSLVYLEDGDHDFKPRGRSPATWKGNLDIAADAVRAFADRVAGG